MKHCLFLFFLLLVVISKSQRTFQKYIRSGDAVYTGMTPNSMGYDASSGTIYMQANIRSASGSLPCFLKLDTCGNVLLANYLNAVGTIGGQNGAFYNGNYLTIVESNGTGLGGYGAYIVTYNSAGNIISSKGVSTNASTSVDLHLLGMKIMPNGDILATGYGPVAGHFKDMYYCKFSSAGNLLWGNYTGRNDSQAEKGWSCDYDPVSLDCYFVGQNVSFSSNSYMDIHIIKTDPNGNKLWEKNIATPYADIGWVVKVLPNRDVLIVANTTFNSSEQEEISLIRLDQNGNLIWSYKYTGPGFYNVIRNVNTLPNGNLLLTGYTKSYGMVSTNDYNGLLMEVDLNGNMVWQYTYGSSTNDGLVSSIIVDNSIISVGDTDFGPPGGSGRRAFLIKTKLDGTFADNGCNIAACNFTASVQNYTIFDASDITASGSSVSYAFTAQNLPVTQTLTCGKPQALFETLPSTACVGTCLSLTDQSLNGVNSWTWTSTAGNISNPNTQHQSSVCFNAVGTYTVKLKVKNCAEGVDSISKVITINAGSTPTITASSTTLSCSQSATLTAIGGSGTYTWSHNGSNASTIVVTPTITTTYTVITGSGTCTSSAVQTITVNPIAIPDIIATSAILSCGESATLTPIGGTWTPVPGTTSIVVTPTVTTSYTVITGSGICMTSAVQTITVIPLPAFNIAGNTSICYGSSTTLTVTGATNYTWSNSPPSTSSIAVVSPTSTTIYSVSGTNAFGCSGIQTVTVTVRPTLTLTVSGNTSICSGGTTTLTAQGALSYTWSSPSTSSISIVSPTTTTTYTVNGMGALGCSGTQTVTVTVGNFIPISITGNTSICAGGNSTLTAQGALSYTWSNLSTSSISIVSPTTTTTYTVNGMGTLGCSGTQTVTVTVGNSIPISVTGNTSICAGETTTLTSQGALSYTWSSPSTSSISVVNPIITTTYSVKGTDAFGCEGTQTIIVAVNPAPTLTVSGINSVCNGSSTTLTVTGATNYMWSNSPPSTFSTVAVSPTSTTIYSVSGTNAFGCKGTQTNTVTVQPIPTLTVNGNTSICSGASSTLTAQGALSYSWSSPSTTSVCIVNPTATTIYTVSGTSASGCIGYQTITVNVHPIPTLTVSGNTSICSGNSTTLTASGAMNYVWSSPSTSSVSIFSPTTTTSYTVTGVTSFGCLADGTFTINVSPTPTLSITGNNTICAGSSATLTASGASNYVWSGIPTSYTTVVLSPTTTTIYNLTGTNALGCMGTQTIMVSVEPVPGISVSGNTLTCLTSTVTLVGAGGGTYLWQGTGILSGSNTAIPVVNLPGTYTLMVTHGNGCISKAYATVVSEASSVQASFQADPTSGSAPLTVNFTNTSSNTSRYQWVFGDGFTSSETHPTHTFQQEGTYEVYLISGQGICTDTVSITLSIEQLFTFYAPNSVTPNEDGINDVFLPKGSGWDETTYSLEIYDRWGELIFTTKNATEGWNAFDRLNGGVVQDGAYTWKVAIRDVTRRQHRYVGHVMVLK